MTDLRIVRTKKQVFDAMHRLIPRRSFTQITVNEICREAMISRATFYVHFDDKYHLLRQWLQGSMSDVYHRLRKETPVELCKQANNLVYENRKSIENVFQDADSETIGIVFDVLCTFSRILPTQVEKTEYVVLSNIFAGGIISYVLWHIRHKFPQDVEAVNEALYNLFEKYLL